MLVHTSPRSHAPGDSAFSSSAWDNEVLDFYSQGKVLGLKPEIKYKGLQTMCLRATIYLSTCGLESLHSSKQQDKRELVLGPNTTRAPWIVSFCGHLLVPDGPKLLFPIHLEIKCVGTNGGIHPPAGTCTWEHWLPDKPFFVTCLPGKEREPFPHGPVNSVKPVKASQEWDKQSMNDRTNNLCLYLI